MRFALCLHGAAVGPWGTPLHDTDRRALALGRAAGAEMIAIEALGEQGGVPMAIGAALDAGADGAILLRDEALLTADADATGYAFASIIDKLKADLVLFGCDADPAGLTDVPACIAHYMTALYVTDVVDMARPGRDGDGDGDADGDADADEEPAVLELAVRAGGLRQRLETPLNAVVGIAAGLVAARPPTRDVDAPRPTPAARVFTLADLEIDPTLVRRRDAHRGIVEPAPRPLVTLQSAMAVVALLRRPTPPS